MKFTDVDLDPRIMKGIEHAGFEECMPVQEETFVHSLEGKDVLVQSQTGSGKTAAFIITILNNLLKSEKKQKALIIAPTRELALQIEKDAKTLTKGLQYIIGTFYGGVGYNMQEDLLEKGVDIVIGTPGRLIDFMNQKKLKVNDVGILVIDEADRLFDMGFFPDIKKIIRKLPPLQERQTMLFSATLSERVRELASKDMNDPEEILLNPDQIYVDNIDQVIYHVGRDEKMRLLLGLLKNEAPANAIIFTNTKRKAEEVARRLGMNGYHCEFIIGDLPQKKRLKIIENVKSGRTPFLIATDVAARGLHVDDLEMVVNFDLPEHIENYVHRIGRTARAGKTGKAVTLVDERLVYNLPEVERFIDMKIPVGWFDDEYLESDKSSGRRVHQQGREGDRDRRTGARRKGGQSQGGKPRRSQQSKSTAGKERKPSSGKQGAPAGKRKPAEVTAGEQKQFAEEKAPVSGTQGKGQSKKAPRRRPDKKRETNKKVDSGKQSAPPKKKDLDSRIKYYEEKYGEEFKVKKDFGEEPDKGLFTKIRKIFRK
jgi:ATP-dependent RNA helicase RhlB